MEPPKYIRIDQAREVLAEMGIELSERQIKRAADPDPNGKRKLPFFVDPIDGRLKIEKGISTGKRRSRQKITSGVDSL